MENNYCVYMHKLETEEGARRYIGITCTRPEYRWNNGKGYIKNIYFWRAIEKYGWNAFEHIILFEGLSKEKACLKEMALIKLFNTTDSKNGFNLTSGGEHSELTEASKEKLRLAKTKFYIDKEVLCYQYLVLDKTIQECAEFFKCGKTTIERYLKKYQIKKKDPWYRKKITKEVLYYQYIILNKTQKELMEYFGCSRATIIQYLKKYKIKKGRVAWNKKEISKKDLYYQYIELDKTAEQCAVYFNCCKDTILGLLKAYGIQKECTPWNKKEISKEELYYQYIILNKTYKKCAEHFGCCVDTLKHYLKKYGIKKGARV